MGMVLIHKVVVKLNAVIKAASILFAYLQ